MKIDELSPVTQLRIKSLPTDLQIKLTDKIESGVGMKRLVKTHISINQLLDLFEAMAEVGEEDIAQMLRMAINTITWRGRQLKKTNHE